MKSGAEVSFDAGPGCRVDPSLEVSGAGRIELGHYVTIGPNVVIDLGCGGGGLVSIGHRTKLKGSTYIRCYNGTCRIGCRTTVGEFTVIYAHGGVVIGDAVGMGPHISIHASTHLVDSATPVRLQGETARGIWIGSGAVLGAGVRVLDDVAIGEESAIGANAVVAGNVPAWAVVAGVPAAFLRWRGSRDRNLSLYPSDPRQETT